MQLHFNHFNFMLERQLYAREGIELVCAPSNLIPGLFLPPSLSVTHTHTHTHRRTHTHTHTHTHTFTFTFTFTF